MYGSAPAGNYAGNYDPSMGAPSTGYPGPSGYPGYGAGAPQPMGQPMGSPPMGTYDPAMGMGQPQVMDPQAWAQQPAQQESEKLEEKKRAREEHHKKREVEHMTKTLRSGQRNHGDNASCANMLCFWGILNGLLWALPLLGDSWWTKIWHGNGIQKLEMTVGLFNMEVHLECEDKVDNSLCYAMKKYAEHENGHWAVAEITGEMCREVKTSCSTMKRLTYAGWGPTALFPAAAGFEVLACFLLYFYWQGKPTALARNLANKCACLAFVCGAFGFVGWMVVSPYMQQIPRFWAAEHGTAEFANNSLFGLKESFTVPMGWCCSMAFFVLISSFIRFFTQYTLPPHMNEPDPLDDESSRLIREAENMMKEGA